MLEFKISPAPVLEKETMSETIKSFFFCDFIIDLFFFGRGSTKGAALRK